MPTHRPQWVKTKTPHHPAESSLIIESRYDGVRDQIGYRPNACYGRGVGGILAVVAVGPITGAVSQAGLSVT